MEAMQWTETPPETMGLYYWTWDARKDQAAPHIIWVDTNGMIALHARFVNDSALPYKIWAPARCIKGWWSTRPIEPAPPAFAPSKQMKDY